MAMLHTVDSVAQDWITRRQQVKLEKVAETVSEIWIRALLPSRAPVSTPTESNNKA